MLNFVQRRSYTVYFLQRHGFRRYLAGLLLPAERSKTLTALANTEPVVGAQRKEAQRLQWFPVLSAITAPLFGLSVLSANVAMRGSKALLWSKSHRSHRVVRQRMETREG